MLRRGRGHLGAPTSNGDAGQPVEVGVVADINTTGSKAVGVPVAGTDEGKPPPAGHPLRPPLRSHAGAVGVVPVRLWGGPHRSFGLKCLNTALGRRGGPTRQRAPKRRWEDSSAPEEVTAQWVGQRGGGVGVVVAVVVAMVVSLDVAGGVATWIGGCRPVHGGGGGHTRSGR